MLGPAVPVLVGARVTCPSGHSLFRTLGQAAHVESSREHKVRVCLRLTPTCKLGSCLATPLWASM